jgi:hypothetical protein
VADAGALTVTVGADKTFTVTLSLALPDGFEQVSV